MQLINRHIIRRSVRKVRWVTSNNNRNVQNGIALPIRRQQIPFLHAPLALDAGSAAIDREQRTATFTDLSLWVAFVISPVVTLILGEISFCLPLLLMAPCAAQISSAVSTGHQFRPTMATGNTKSITGCPVERRIVAFVY